MNGYTFWRKLFKGNLSFKVNFEIEVSTNEIVNKKQTKASWVTDLVKKLSDNVLVVYKKHKGVIITNFGRNRVANIIRKYGL